MKATVKNTATVDTKKVVNKVSTIESKAINLLKAVTPKKEKVVKEKIVHAINFKSTQLFHSEFKKDSLSLGAIRVNILRYNESLTSNDDNKLNPLLVGLLERMKEKQNYEFIKANFAPNSKGFYSSYKLLMYFRKNLELIQKSFK
jgi:hypothetical protein